MRDKLKPLGDRVGRKQHWSRRQLVGSAVFVGGTRSIIFSSTSPYFFNCAEVSGFSPRGILVAPSPARTRLTGSPSHNPDRPVAVRNLFSSFMPWPPMN